MRTVLSSVVCFVFAGLTHCSDDEPTLRFYKRAFNNFVEVPLTAGQQIVRSDWYQSDKSTVFFAHGFTGGPLGPAVTAVISAYLATGNCNVVLLNWEKMAAQRATGTASSYLNWASPNAKKLGVVFADTLASMADAGLQINTTHLVGHSLGAQIYGIAGAKLASRGIIVPWITGLDPARIGYDGNTSNLNSRCAAYVDIVHSDPSKYGYRRAHGTVDYWPNFSARGPVRQPGCEAGPYTIFTSGDLCSHNRSWQLLVDSLLYPRTLLASHGKNYRAWKNSDPAARRLDVLAFAELPTRTASGDYYLITNERSPYGRGYEGI